MFRILFNVIKVTKFDLVKMVYLTRVTIIYIGALPFRQDKASFKNPLILSTKLPLWKGSRDPKLQLTSFHSSLGWEENKEWKQVCRDLLVSFLIRQRERGHSYRGDSQCENTEINTNIRRVSMYVRYLEKIPESLKKTYVNMKYVSWKKFHCHKFGKVQY